MGKPKWSDIKASDIKASQTQKPKNHEELSLKQLPQTTKKGREHQKFLDKFIPKINRASKPKTERGEGVFKGRTHHWHVVRPKPLMSSTNVPHHSAACKNPYSALCRARGHMVPCGYHPDNNTLPGDPCAECNNETAAEIRNEEKNIEQEERRAQKLKEMAWFKDDKQRKKPGAKEGRGSYKQRPRPQDLENLRLAEEAELRRKA
ncbi:MAG: hypothetical protein Q9196_001892 [Gyalolechia fulgens]